MRVTVNYFALLRERAGKSEEAVETEASTAIELYRSLDQRYGFALPEKRIRIAVNESFQPQDYPLAEHDQIVFIVPVSGG